MDGQMSNEKLINERIRRITDSILEDYKNGRDIDKMDVFSQPDSDAVTDIVNKLLNILSPATTGKRITEATTTTAGSAY